MRAHRVFRTVATWFSLLCLVAIVIGATGPDTNGPRMIIAYFGVAGLLVFWIGYWAIAIGWNTGGAINELRRPVPSPQEIRAHFVQEMHREPTLEEVSGIEQMLHNEKQRAAWQAGAGLATLWFLNR